MSAAQVLGGAGACVRSVLARCSSWLHAVNSLSELKNDKDQRSASSEKTKVFTGRPPSFQTNFFFEQLVALIMILEAIRPTLECFLTQNNCVAQYNFQVFQGKNEGLENVHIYFSQDYASIQGISCDFCIALSSRGGVRSWPRDCLIDSTVS